MKEIVKIVNTKQAGMYIKHGLEPIKLYWNKASLVFEFDKEASKPLFDLWCKHELV